MCVSLSAVPKYKRKQKEVRKMKSRRALAHAVIFFVGLCLVEGEWVAVMIMMVVNYDTASDKLNCYTRTPLIPIIIIFSQVFYLVLSIFKFCKHSSVFKRFKKYKVTSIKS